jgi:hypothetical protein
MTFVFPKENVGADGVSPVLLADCALEPWPSWPRSHRPSQLRRAEVASIVTFPRARGGNFFDDLWNDLTQPLLPTKTRC